MEVILLIIGALLLAGVSGLVMTKMGGRSGVGKSLMGFGSSGRSVSRTAGGAKDNDVSLAEFRNRKKSSGKKGVTLEEKFFRAGMFSVEERRDFHRMRVILPVVGAALGLFGGTYLGGQWLVIAPVFGGLLGYQAPFSILDRKIAARNDDIMFYLPLVIEQIVIGVSSSLDVGPCLQRVVSMADERDSHNSVTELIRHAQMFMKSGASMEEALTEVGRLSGHTELKHSFMSLAQVAKHGGEITRQLQELADAVASQRETRIEAKIKKLELEATGPVGLVFVGFLVILLIGFGFQVMKAFD